MWTLYAPLFENGKPVLLFFLNKKILFLTTDNVYVRDGMVFTVIHGGQLQCLPELSSQKSALSVSVREAEKAYGVLLKANTVKLFSARTMQSHESLVTFTRC